MAKRETKTVSVNKIKAEYKGGINPNIPYVTYVPESPIKMTEARKKRIRKVVHWHNKGKDPKFIAEKLGEDVKTIKKDLTTAMTLTAEAMPYVPKLEKQIMTEVKTTIEKSGDLYDRINTVLAEVEEQENLAQNPKAIMSYSMLLGELRQSLELTAKLSGELQTGTRVNVITFSSFIKKIIGILQQELDRTTFLRLRDRIRLELEGQQPLGSKGGDITIDVE